MLNKCNTATLVSFDDDDLLLWSRCTNFHTVATLHCRNNTDVTHTLIIIAITEEDVQHWKTNH